MVKDVIQFAKNQVEKAKKDLKDAEELITRLRKAGENVAELQTKMNELKLKVKRYEEAFK